MYIQIKDNAIERVFPQKLKWYSSDPNKGGEQLTDAEFKARGVLPLVETRPDYNPDTQRIERDSQAQWVIGENEVTCNYTIVAIPLIEQAEISERNATQLARETKITAAREGLKKKSPNTLTGLRQRVQWLEDIILN